MTIHCNISQADGQEELGKKKIRLHAFCFLGAIPCQQHKIFVSINRFKHVLNSKTTVILLEPVVLLRHLQDKTVPMSSNQQGCKILPLAELNSFQEMKDTQ